MILCDHRSVVNTNYTLIQCLSLYLCRWVEDGSLVEGDGGSFTNWGEDEPDDGESENCMGMYWSDGTWYDINCDYPYDAVCSKPIASATATPSHNITRA